MLKKSDTALLPLWLSFACNELRIFGEFTTLTKRIEQLPGNLDDLIKFIINRINGDFEGDVVVEVNASRVT
jgi:hypothetical protein